MITAGFGLATFKWKNPCVAVPFAIITLLVGLGLMVLGGFLNGLGSGLNMIAFREHACGGFP